MTLESLCVFCAAHAQIVNSRYEDEKKVYLKRQLGFGRRPRKSTNAPAAKQLRSNDSRNKLLKTFVPPPICRLLLKGAGLILNKVLIHAVVKSGCCTCAARLERIHLLLVVEQIFG